MLTEKDKILKYLHGEKSWKVPVAYYSDIECLIKQIDKYHYNPEETSTTRVRKHDPCGVSIVTKSPLTNIREKK